MEKAKRIKWKEMLLYEKVCAVLVNVFFMAALSLIVLDFIYDIRLLSKLSSLFIFLELICECIANFRTNKKLYTVLIVIESIILVLALIRIFV